MDLSSTQLANLKAHLAAYQLGEVAALLNEATTADETGGLDLGATFLHAAGRVQARLIKLAGNPDFLFWLKADTDPQPLAASLPQMLPYAPTQADAEAFPFPQLGMAELSAPQWQYVYVSDPARWPALAPPDLLTSTLGIGPNGSADWHGGLFFSGQYVVPLDKLLPDSSAWLAVQAPALAGDGTAVTGYIDYRNPSALPDLKLRIPLVEKTFDEGLIDKIALSLELASPVYYLDGGGATGHIGLVGTLRFRSSPPATGTNLIVTGTWPLDNDQVMLGIRAVS